MLKKETGNDKGDIMKDKKKKKQKSEEKLKKKKLALLTDEKIEKEDKKKKKKKQLQAAEDLERKESAKALPEGGTSQGVRQTEGMEEVFTALNQTEKAEKSAGKTIGRKSDKAGKPVKTANRKKTADEVSEDEAALIFRALGDETRLRIVGMLEEHELCAADLLKSVSIVQSTLSHHMKILCDSGAVNCRREGRWSYYSINAEVMEKAADYLKKYRKA